MRLSEARWHLEPHAPQILRHLVGKFVQDKRLDVYSPEKMRKKCDILSRQLADWLTRNGIESRAIDLDPSRHGFHVVVLTHADTDVGSWMIDLTAAQFPELGYVAPRIQSEVRWSYYAPRTKRFVPVDTEMLSDLRRKWAG